MEAKQLLSLVQGLLGDHLLNFRRRDALLILHQPIAPAAGNRNAISVCNRLQILDLRIGE